MTKEISPVCDFIFGSIRTGLLMDTVNVELMVRTVSICTEKTIQPNPRCFHHGVGLLFPFLHCKGKFRHIKMRITRHRHRIKDMPSPISLLIPSLSVDIPQGRLELGGLTRGIDST